MLEVVEAASFSKTGDETLNEDAYTVEEGVIAVFDGETTKGNLSFRRLDDAPRWRSQKQLGTCRSPAIP